MDKSLTSAKDNGHLHPTLRSKENALCQSLCVALSPNNTTHMSRQAAISPVAAADASPHQSTSLTPNLNTAHLQHMSSLSHSVQHERARLLLYAKHSSSWAWTDLQAVREVGDLILILSHCGTRCICLCLNCTEAACQLALAPLRQ